MFSAAAGGFPIYIVPSQGTYFQLLGMQTFQEATLSSLADGPVSRVLPQFRSVFLSKSE